VNMSPIGSSYKNEYEVKIIIQLIQKLLRDGIEPNDIGIIAMFRAQAELITATIEKEINIEKILREKDKREEFNEEREKEKKIIILDDSNEDEDDSSSNSGEKRKRGQMKTEKKKTEKKKPIMKRRRIKLGKKAFQQRCYIKVSTVDAFQGAEREIILLSTTRTNLNIDSTSSSCSDIDTNHLTSPNRLCVALTRARRHLILIGHLNCLHRHGGIMWKTIIDQMFRLKRIINAGPDGLIHSKSIPKNVPIQNIQNSHIVKVSSTGKISAEKIKPVIRLSIDKKDQLAAAVPADDLDLLETSSEEENDDEDDPFLIHDDDNSSKKKDSQRKVDDDQEMRDTYPDDSQDSAVELMLQNSSSKNFDGKDVLMDSDDEADALLNLDIL
jgi:hypothetical protein